MVPMTCYSAIELCLKEEHLPRKILIAMLLTVIHLCGYAETDRFKKVETVVQDAIVRGVVPGAVALVLHRDKVVHFKAYGYSDEEKRIKMSKDALFRIFSMSKQVTATAVLLLVDEGKLSLSDPVARYIPEFANPQVLVPCGPDVPDCSGDYKLIPAKRDITVAHLLSNTSGITYSFLGSPFVSDLYVQANISDGLVQTYATTAENIKALAKMPLVAHPGETYQYGLGADVAGYLVEVVAGQRFGDFCKARIFEPLGMNDTAFFISEQKAQRLAKAYSLDQKGWRVPMPAGTNHYFRFTYSHDFHYRGPQTYDSGGAGLVTTAQDFAAFLRMLTKRGRFAGKPFLSKSSWDTMRTSHTKGLPGAYFYEGYGFGLGAAIHTEPKVSGRKSAKREMRWAGLFYTHYQVDPENGIASLIFSQLWPYGDAQLADNFHDAVYETLKPE